MGGLRVYISGKITGLDLEYARIKFQESEDDLLEINPKYIPVNPMKVCPYNPDKTWEDYMAEDIKELLHCDAIYMQKGYGESKGARCEYALAKELDLIIMFEKDKKYDKNNVAEPI